MGPITATCVQQHSSKSGLLPFVGGSLLSSDKLPLLGLVFTELNDALRRLFALPATIHDGRLRTPERPSDLESRSFGPAIYAPRPPAQDHTQRSTVVPMGVSNPRISCLAPAPSTKTCITNTLYFASKTSIVDISCRKLFWPHPTRDSRYGPTVRGVLAN